MCTLCDMRKQAMAAGADHNTIAVFDKVMERSSLDKLRNAAVRTRDLNGLAIDGAAAQAMYTNGYVNGVMASATIMSEQLTETARVLDAARATMRQLDRHYAKNPALQLDTQPLRDLLRHIAEGEIAALTEMFLQTGENVGVRRQLALGTEHMDNMLEEQFAMIGERAYSKENDGAQELMTQMEGFGMTRHAALIEIGKRMVTTHLEVYAELVKASDKHRAGDSTDFHAIVAMLQD